MAELSALYADALFKLAVEGGTVDGVYGQAVLLREMLRDADCRKILTHPHIPDGEKRSFFESAFGGGMDKNLFSLLLLSIAKNRETHFIAALKELVLLIDKYNKKATANVVTAVELDGEQVAELRELLSGKLGKHVDVSVKVDPSVIGGPFIYVDGYYMDMTIKKKLQDMAAEMKVGCGA